ncbi:5'-nucleotidase C-terminal domain-containing protein [Arenibaculum pallidiluteum]|uniref:5'-nucleotidase C-terminal domain-containing protein n=1 Tax=Arenibaculum pallidiluteum TaxID=2812559 RepID=UPI001A967842|nr:5'-nucleotidase C-terminal domain-containing protein [Arenibaculum pallidiluteum]
MSDSIAAGSSRLQILHASDLEGGVDAIGRAANFAAIEAALEREVETSITLSAGDNYIPGPFLNASGDPSLAEPFTRAYDALFGLPEGAGFGPLGVGAGRADITLMNLIGFDASALGNHEFDLGPGQVGSIIGTEAEADQGIAGIAWPGAQFPYLTANLEFPGSSLEGLFTPDLRPASSFATDLDDPTADPAKIAASTIVEDNGERVGVIGLTTPDLDRISSPGDVGVIGSNDDLSTLADLVNGQAERLAAEGVNKIVLVSHLQQLQLEANLAPLLQGVDVVIAGGSDTLLADETDPLQPGDTPDGAYPLIATGADGNPIAIVSTDGEYSYVGRLVVTFDGNGVLDPDSIDAEESGAYATTDEVVDDLYADGEDPFADGTPGGEARQIVDAVAAIVTEQDGNILGRSSVFLDGQRSEVRTEETNFGDLAADANLAAAKAFDGTVMVSIKNGGGIRAPIGEIADDGTPLPPQANPEAGKEAGEVSELDVTNALRFNNSLTLVTLTPEQLLGVLEHAVSGTAEGATPGQFAQIGGLAFSFDPERPPGGRVETVRLLDADGNPGTLVVDEGSVAAGAPEAIRIVTPGFLVDGGDGYPFPDYIAADPAFADRVDLDDALTEEGAAGFAPPGTEQDALAEYLLDEFSDQPFDRTETAPEEDERIQNLAVREDGLDEDGDGGGEVSIDEIQGAGHRSALEGQVVTTRGIVTAVDGNGYYLQAERDADGNAATSSGIFVFTGDAPAVSVGTELRITGEVAEFTPGGADGGNLSTTEITGVTQADVKSVGNDLPEAVVLGEERRAPTSVIDDDGLALFQPSQDGIDFYESLEGMRVTVGDALAVSPTNGFGEIVALAGGGDATGLNERDSLVIARDDFNPERIQLQFDADVSSGIETPSVETGARLGDVTGVLGYGFGNFELLVQDLGRVRDGDLARESAGIDTGPGRLTIAGYNVENLDPNDSDGDGDLADGKFDLIARQIVENLDAPDIVALQEVQDASGSADDGTITGAATAQALITAIAAAGGPAYSYVEVAPEDGTSGGQPGGNIRNGYLFDPLRVDYVEGSTTVIGPRGDGAFLDARNPLHARFEFEGQAVDLINVHNTSKGGSTPLFGTEQPPVNGGEDQRTAQGEAVNAFVDGLLDADPDANVVVLGDFNEFQFLEPLEAVAGTGLDRVLTNLAGTLPAGERYSYNFEGNAQALDHVLVTDSLLDDALYDIVHMNAEFADRASDHDATLVSLGFGNRAGSSGLPLPEEVGFIA